MPSLLILVVLLTTLTTIISTVGATTINQLLWNIYSRITGSAAVAKHAALRREVLELRKTLVGTSSQDEFAKWAKVRRTLDKKQAELEKLQAGVQGMRSGFDAKASMARWTLTTGLRFFLQFWYSKQAIFWLPEGWVPWYVEWGLSFPRAPMGSVSIQVWTFAVGQAMTILFAVGAWAMESLLAAKHSQAEPVPMQGQQQQATGDKKKAK
ncbi:CHD5-like protein-domain-containing protein [Geopyxis carbonaria]|nr:CHD5-like protein-domain-containing protein [Geopyxis carbonaria]